MRMALIPHLCGKNKMSETAKEIIRYFNTEGEIIDIKPLGNGLINKTFLASSNTEKYVLQKINGNVFKQIKTLVQNKSIVSGYLKQKGLISPQFIDSVQQKSFYIDQDSDCWQLSEYIPKTSTQEKISNPNIAKEAGRVIGEFHNALKYLPQSKLGFTIKDFHNTLLRFKQLILTINKDSASRVLTSTGEIERIISFAEEVMPLAAKIEKKEIPVRIVHNDTKINNILFDNHEKAICMIDLDTVMPGSILHDFGEAMRSGANMGEEDDPDLANVSFNISLFENFSQGYLGIANDFLTEAELHYLPLSVKLITFEQAVRFLSDYLSGDIYYTTDYTEHNLIRARAQIKLYQSVSQNYSGIQSIIASNKKARSNDLA